MHSNSLSSRELAWLRLSLTPRLGRKTMHRLHQVFGSIEAIVADTTPARLARAGLSPKLAAAIPAAQEERLLAAARRLARGGVRLISYWDADFPPLLAAIPDPPALLYVRGHWPPEPGLAVVGSRRAGAQSRQLTREIARDLAARGVCIISGLARGIDTAAHQGALDADGATLAVLGCGIDQIYPPENRVLFEKIAEVGTLVSEYAPGTPPFAGNFPGRNRIVSGLARGVLVAEAAAGSGSLITAEFALEQGREVFALPGSAHDSSCSGSNALLKQGAHLITEARDILEILWSNLPQAPRTPAAQTPETLSAEDLRVLAPLDATALHIDEIVRRSGLTPMEVSAILLHLELQGSVRQLPGMHYQRVRSG
ncbi:DNA-processing protein DprA [Geoalkalibacter halelectricus]|uniref:DNA-processing protein DprA n=1 Tax=Geoalkalibacter halelectricus TaxID=2847045 RepID=A0ABY5ZS63_9BACT|nr:DNA-processing protein DprA [Geoalkalibacter halelectricus]UWZ80782.1 DNA-processing protein DprA [Geoalkalibacter halelectricus]